MGPGRQTHPGPVDPRPLRAGEELSHLLVRR